MSNHTSQIARAAAAALMAIFEGQTVTFDAVLAQITTQYAIENKRTGITSYSQVVNLIERSGATSRYTGPNYTGECFYTFPAAA